MVFSKIPVNICGIACGRPTLRSHQSVIHSPLGIDFCSFNLIIPTEISQFVALNVFRRPREFSKY